VVYKGNGRLDLRAAELTAPVTTIIAVAYRSRIDVLVPPGVRLELDGFGVSKAWSEHEVGEPPVPRRPRGCTSGALPTAAGDRAGQVIEPAAAPVTWPPQRASSPSRSSGAIIGPAFISCSQASAGTRHMTSNSMPLGSLA
jgi:hypothetical protein